VPITPSATFDRDLLLALGELVVRHAALEESLRQAIWLQAQGERIVVDVLLTGLSFSTLVDKFGATFYEHHPSSRLQVKELCSRLGALNDQRNSLIHSFWRPVSGSPDMTRLKASAKPSSGLVMRSQGVPASVVHSLAEELGKAEEALWSLVTPLLPSSRQ
jgi:hypothetical protein